MKTMNLLVLAAFLLAPMAAGIQLNPPPGVLPEDGCTNYADDHFGGTTASCAYICSENAWLSVHVKANDSGSKVDGSNVCGGASAECGPKKGSCEGYSDEKTAKSGEGSCRGTVEEIITDGVSVTCVATPEESEGPGEDCQIRVGPVCVEETPGGPRPLQLGAVLVRLIATTDAIIGSVCTSYGCDPVDPVCQEGKGYTTCEIRYGGMGPIAEPNVPPQLLTFT